MSSEIEEFNQFIERMSKIRDLSSPPIYDVDDENEYSNRLRENFKTIGQLARENRKMLDEVLYPLLEPERRLTEEVAEQMNAFSQKLLSIASDFTDYENLDLPIMTLIGEKLVHDAFEEGTIEEQINRMDSALISNYSMMNMTERITANPAISKKFKDRGLQIGDFFLNLIKKENFLNIENEDLRELVLTNARFSSAFYERSTDKEENQKNLELLDYLMTIPDDPFYQKAIPNCNWRYYKIRTLGYYLQCTDIANVRGFTQEQIKRIVKAADEAEKLIATDPKYFETINGNDAIPLFCARNRYLIGLISEDEYLKIMLDLYEHRDKNEVGPDEDLANVLVPLEIILFINQKKHPTAQDLLLIKKLYNSISAYMFRMPNAGGLTFVMEFFAEVVNNFVEVPGGITFEDFGLQSLAALHPPTYIHSNMVGQISVCLCSYLIDIKPEVFIGFNGYKDIDEVKRNRDKILYFTFHASVCHDFRKIPIIDTIFVYGRRLLDDEFGIIKTHPLMGYSMLKKYPSTCDYAEVALGHHRFHDDSKGYPEIFQTNDSKYKTIIDLVLCADCMDAATDSVGRSYNSGKTLSDFIEEVSKGAGTRYASWLPELFENEALIKDINFILTTGREETYRDTFLLLKNVKEKES